MGVFLQTSIKNYASFLLQIIMAANISVLMLISLLIGEITIYNYILSVICYYLIMYHANEFLLSYLDYAILQSKQNFINSEIKNIESMSQFSALYNSNYQLENASKGLSLDFKNVQIKLCGKKMLEIKKLHIESNDIIGITGNGTHLIASVLYKLLKFSGTIMIENNELSMLSQDYLNKLLAVVPNDLQIQNISIT